LASGTIKNIIFDLGGVLMDINPQKTADLFAELSNTSPVDIIEIHNSNNFFKEYEKGLINDQAFRDHIRGFLNVDISDNKIDEIWSEMLLGFPQSKIELLDYAKSKYRIFLLSNTNKIHTIKFERIFKELTGMDIRDYFENVHYSFKMHARKPEPLIFNQVMAENDLQTNETIFIDDSLPNIETADKLGLKTRHVEINQTDIKIDF
jgi:putative hydrolase of the HAD superfamily